MPTNGLDAPYSQLEGIEAILSVTVGDQASLFDSELPPELLRLPEEFGRVDALLDDSVFLAPLVPPFDPRVGRLSTPMEIYLAADVPQVPLPAGIRSLVS